MLARQTVGVHTAFRPVKVDFTVGAPTVEPVREFGPLLRRNYTLAQGQPQVNVGHVQALDFNGPRLFNRARSGMVSS